MNIESSAGRHSSILIIPLLLAERLPSALMAWPSLLAFEVVGLLIVFAAIPTTMGILWIVHRMTENYRQRYESLPTIELDSVQPDLEAHHSGECPAIDSSEPDGRVLTESIVSPSSSNQYLLDLDRLPTRSELNGTANVVDRKRRCLLTCDTSVRYAVDVVVTPPILPPGSGKAFQILPIYGFDASTITPPVGSPLWTRKPDSAGTVDSPRSIWREQLLSGKSVPFSAVIEGADLCLKESSRTTAI